MAINTKLHAAVTVAAQTLFDLEGASALFAVTRRAVITAALAEKENPVETLSESLSTLYREYSELLEEFNRAEIRNGREYPVGEVTKRRFQAERTFYSRESTSQATQIEVDGVIHFIKFKTSARGGVMQISCQALPLADANPSGKPAGKPTDNPTAGKPTGNPTTGTPVSVETIAADAAKLDSDSQIVLIGAIFNGLTRREQVDLLRQMAQQIGYATRKKVTKKTRRAA